jgi:hypothetical protein
VCPLEKALRGHPDVGGYWEQHCDNHLGDCRFGPVTPTDRAWRSCYFTPPLKCYMIVCVDEFKIAGSQDDVAEAWRLIRAPNPRAGERGIILDESAEAGRFLGCNHECAKMWGRPMSGDQNSVRPLGGGAADTATSGV